MSRPEESRPSRIAPLGYRFARALARLWFAWTRTQLLGAERIRFGGAAFLLVNSPARLRELLLLVAALEERLHWLIDGSILQGPFSRMMARWLGVMNVAESAVVDERLVDECLDRFRRGGLVVLFAGNPEGKAAGTTTPCETAARLAIEAAKRYADPVEVAVFPVDVFHPGRGLKTAEALIYVEGAIYPGEYLHRADRVAERAAHELASAFEAACGSNAFRLFPRELARFLKQLEEVLRGDLGDDWARRPGWRQRVEDFELSRFVRRWIDQTNAREPARIVAMGEGMEALRESQRRWTMRGFEVETAGKWIESSFRRGLAWAETFCGFPLGLFGLVNHLPAGAILAVAEHRWRPEEHAAEAKWTMRGLVILACYAIQVLLCDKWLGRAQAGYYALSLPLSGAYLWRYSWLLRRRTRRALFRLLVPVSMGRLRRARRSFVGEVDRRVGDFASSLGVPH